MLKRLKYRLRREAFHPTKLGIVFSPVYIIRSRLHKSISSLAPRLRGQVLDFGCGSKPYESLFAHADSYLGIDIAVSGHDHAHSKVDIFYDGKTIPFPDQHFDSVVSFEVLEHVFNIDGALAEISRVLRDDGLLLLTIPFAWNEHEQPFDFARYTSFGIRHILERHGLRPVEIQKTTTYWLAVCQMLLAYLSQYVSPGGTMAHRLFQLLVICPITILALSLNRVLPERYDYFCNLTVLARKAG